MVPLGTDRSERSFPQRTHGVDNGGTTQDGLAQEACEQDIDAASFTALAQDDI
jgi:hypothetical protein